MKNKFWFQSLCWFGWFGLTLLVIYTSKPDIRAWTIMILAVWIGMVIIPTLWRRKKAPASEPVPFFKRLKSNSWFWSFIICVGVGVFLWILPWSAMERHPWIAILSLFGFASLCVAVSSFILSRMSIQSINDKIKK